MIKPTVGRKVWYRPFGDQAKALSVWDTTQPCDATVTYVWHDRMVNLMVFGPSGLSLACNSVTLLQDDDIPPNLISGGYAEWMPYQTAQAAKGA